MLHLAILDEITPLEFHSADWWRLCAGVVRAIGAYAKEEHAHANPAASATHRESIHDQCCRDRAWVVGASLTAYLVTA